MARLVQTQPTSMYWPPPYPGGQPQQVYVCELGCLVLQAQMGAHSTMAHA